MRRREFIGLLGSAAALPPLPVFSQEAARTYRIAVMTQSSRMTVNYIAFFDELRNLGFVEGRNLAVDPRGFAARPEQFPELAVLLVKSSIDALVCGGDEAIRAG
jgi:hypothetical protein